MAYENRKFKESLSFGAKVEEYVLSQIQKKYPEAHMPGGYNKNWDIFIPEIKKGIEVKCDMSSNVNLKMLVEVTMNNKPSALLTTNAFYWVFYDGFSLFWIKPIEIMKAILIEGIRVAEFTGGTDKYAKKAYFVPKEIIRKYSDVISEPLADVPKDIQYDPEKQKRN
jgi:hypothetical protein